MAPIDNKIPRNDPGIAGFATESWESHEEPRYGDGVPTTTHQIVTSTAGVTLALYSIVNIDADGEITLAVYDADEPTATHILAMPIALTAGQEMSVALYREGHWNMNAMVWHSSFNTDAKKQHAFEGSISPTIFMSKHNFPNSAIDI